MSDINMTPLIDVMLVLLVIFIITAPLLTSAVRLELPKTEAAKAAASSKAITVVVDAAGLVYLKDQAVTAQELADQFADAHQANPDTEVQLRADLAVPYGRIVEVMGAAHKAGLNRLGFVADSRAPTLPVAVAPAAPGLPGGKP